MTTVQTARRRIPARRALLTRPLNAGGRSRQHPAGPQLLHFAAAVDQHVTAALSGEVIGTQPAPTRRRRPGKSGLMHGAVGPLSSRTTSRQPVLTIELEPR